MNELLEYDPVTGVITWRSTGNPAGHRDAVRGYIRIMVDGKNYYAHRLAWFLMTGAWPKHGIDHRNRNTSDNSWENLRDVTQAVNLLNQGRLLAGVTWSKANSRWQARIDRNGKQQRLGYFTDWFDAVCARKAGEARA